MRLSDVLISKDEAVDTVRKMCQMILDKCATHYDEDLKDEVYDNTLEVDAILRCNKYIRIALNALPYREEDSTGKIDSHDVLTWLLHYHKCSFDLHGRYLPHEVIGWLVADISKNLLNITETEGQYGK